MWKWIMRMEDMSLDGDRYGMRDPSNEKYRISKTSNYKTKVIKKGE